MTSVPATAPPISSYEVLADGFKLYLRYAGLLLGASIALQVLQVAASFAVLSQSGPDAMESTAPIDSVVAQLMIAVCTIVLLAHRKTGRAPSPKELFATFSARVLPLLAVAVITTAVIQLAWTWLLIVGAVLGWKLAVAAPTVITHRASPVAAIKLSWSLTKGHLGTVFAVVFMQGMIVLGIPYLANYLAPYEVEDWLLIYSALIALVLPWTAMATAILAEQLCATRTEREAASALIDAP